MSSMRKRNLPKVYIGSMQKNFWGLIIKSEFFYNYKDPIALKYLEIFKRRMIGKHKQKNLHPNFEFNISNIVGVDNHSYVQHTWLNNMSQKFYLHHSRHAIEEMYHDITICNKICKSQRDYEGCDDEPEDEDKRLM